MDDLNEIDIQHIQVEEMYIPPQNENNALTDDEEYIEDFKEGTYVPQDNTDISKDDFKHSLSDVLNEFKDYLQYFNYEKQISPSKYAYSRSSPKSDALLKLFIPHLFGIVVGCAFARLIHIPLGGYVAFAFIFSVFSGTVKNHYIDNIALKFSVIRNTILALPLLVVFILIFALVCLIIKGI